MIAVIRIAGRVGLRKDVAETLDRLRLRRKFACVLVDEKDMVKIGMVKKVGGCVAYGKISAEIEKKLKKERGEKVRQGENKGKLKAFFRLHPPRGGFKKSTKKFVLQGGVLGKWEGEQLSKLLEKML